MREYGKEPVEIATNITIDNSEMYFYQYLPISLAGSVSPYVLPDQLMRTKDLVDKCVVDFIQEYCKGDIEEFSKYYVYLTAKNLYMGTGTNINRQGWHSDGFGTDDVNYIWSNCVPTQYLTGNILPPENDEEALEFFEDIGLDAVLDNTVKLCKTNTIYRLDDSVIHSCGFHVGKPILRHFIKVSFSKEKYNLKGNSHNYLLNYQWDMVDRGETRNHPNK